MEGSFGDLLAIALLAVAKLLALGTSGEQQTDAEQLVRNSEK
jgi:hypothetical protein